MKIAKGLAAIGYFLCASPLFLVGWLVAFVWTPLAGGFWWGNRHIDTLLSVKAHAWKHRVTPPNSQE